MGKIKLEVHHVGQLSTNCYFIINTETNECLVADPGENAEGLYARIKQEGYKPVAIILTHGHFDHIMGVNELRKQVNDLHSENMPDVFNKRAARILPPL